MPITRHRLRVLRATIPLLAVLASGCSESKESDPPQASNEPTAGSPTPAALQKSTANLRTCRDIALAKTQYSPLFESAAAGGGAALSTGQSLGLQLLLNDAAAAGPEGQLLDVATTFVQAAQDIQASGSGVQTFLSAETAVGLSQAVTTGAEACSTLGITPQEFAGLPPVGS